MSESVFLASMLTFFFHEMMKCVVYATRSFSIGILVSPVVYLMDGVLMSLRDRTCRHQNRVSLRSLRFEDESFSQPITLVSPATPAVAKSIPSMSMAPPVDIRIIGAQEFSVSSTITIEVRNRVVIFHPHVEHRT